MNVRQHTPLSVPFTIQVPVDARVLLPKTGAGHRFLAANIVFFVFLRKELSAKPRCSLQPPPNVYDIRLKNGWEMSVQDGRRQAENRTEVVQFPACGVLNSLPRKKSFLLEAGSVKRLLSYDELQLLVFAVAVGDACHIASLLEVEVYAS